MNIYFTPLLPNYLLITIATIIFIIGAIAVMAKQRGSYLRAGAFLLILLALLNPVFTNEEREPVKNIVSVIVDKSQSQLIQTRKTQTEQTLALLEKQLARHNNIDVRVRDVKHTSYDNPSTDLFSALRDEISDIPANRLAGTIMITDGQIHDIPENLNELGINSPIHALITGHENEVDLRIEITKTPRFGIVGKSQTLNYKIYFDGHAPDFTQSAVDVNIKLNGKIISRESAPINRETSTSINIPFRGDNLIEFSVNKIANEISERNNKAIAQIKGIRQNLRVLLISGSPYAGGRAWRDLLKSDTSIDLVHLTILRSSMSNDSTPVDELSLIVFPTEELFVEKIDDFDLIILDRFRQEGILSTLYYENIARYVQDGGALLIAAGPEFAGIQSIATTALKPILPAYPTGQVRQSGFYPRLSEQGLKHPVTRDLPGGNVEPPDWGRWFRSIKVFTLTGDTIFNGPEKSPLLILDRVNKGRVAMLLSDQSWLWSRGFEGGGPHVALYRRIAHWLMQEPTLEEEALFATVSNNQLQISRQTMDDNTAMVTITSPSGKTQNLTLPETAPGKFELGKQVEETGLYEIYDNELSALVHVGAINAAEFKENISTINKITPITLQSKGITHRVVQDNKLTLPQIVPLKHLPLKTNERMLLQTSNQTILVGITQIPLLGGLSGLAALLMILSFMWYREGY